MLIFLYRKKRKGGVELKKAQSSIVPYFAFDGKTQFYSISGGYTDSNGTTHSRAYRLGRCFIIKVEGTYTPGRKLGTLRAAGTLNNKNTPLTEKTLTETMDVYDISSATNLIECSIENGFVTSSDVIPTRIASKNLKYDSVPRTEADYNKVVSDNNAIVFDIEKPGYYAIGMAVNKINFFDIEFKYENTAGQSGESVAVSKIDIVDHTKLNNIKVEYDTTGNEVTNTYTSNSDAVFEFNGTTTSNVKIYFKRNDNGSAIEVLYFLDGSGITITPYGSNPKQTTSLIDVQ